MPDIPLKTLLGRCNTSVTTALETAAGACVQRHHYEVTPEHLAVALLDQGNGDWATLLKHHAIDAARLRRVLDGELDALRSGNAGRPVFSPRLSQWLQAGWMMASLELGLADIRSGVLLLALCGDAARIAGGDWVDLLAGISVEQAKSKLDSLLAHSGEEPAKHAAPRSAGDGKSAGTALDKFCTDFTAKAKAGKLDPVFGRDSEIRQMVDILARRRKNNPICVGEPGVGKTAVVEGLALMVVEGHVPDVLKNVRIVGLDLSLLQAGASVKGEFENRLKTVLDEIKSSAIPVILFIDEAHTLIGAGGAAGTGDAANLMKPALARGELRTIAATTWAEYKKYFEKDAALARRFQVVKLDEPSVETTHAMLRGLRPIYEQAHGVIIRDDALQAAAVMGARYIAGRQHPDKGIDLIDTAAARVKVALASKPGELQDVERRIQSNHRAVASLHRDRDTGGPAHAEAIADLEAALIRDRAAQGELMAAWQAEKVAADAAIAARSALIAAPADEQRKAAFASAVAALGALQAGKGLMHIEVTPEVIAKVIADWTGVPVGSMVKDEAAALLRFEQELGKRIKGQDHALRVIGTGVRAAKSGLKDPNQPLGVFLFVGPSGVGKTETATGVADLVFGGERFMTTINMSEYQEKHTVSRLVGSPPGYVGYGEGGVLTEAVRQRPYSVVLLDEVEKADLEVMNLFYQVFDKGTLSDGEGREIDFRNTIIFLTSNLATQLIMEACADADKPSVEALVAAIRPELSRHFKPALLARMTIVPFFPISAEALSDIAALKLARLAKRLLTTHKVVLDISPAVTAAIAARCTEAETGARNVDHVIAGNLMPRISQAILSRMGEGAVAGTLAIGLGSDGDFSIAFT